MKLLWIQLAAALFQTDMAVKQRIETSPDMERTKSFCNDRIRIQKLHNYGTAGSKFQGHGKGIAFMNGLAALACVAGFIRSLWLEEGNRRKLGYALLTGGAASNLFDRCVRGYVVDYVSFRTPWKWLNDLVFNLADFFIFTGSFLISIGVTARNRK